MADVDWMVNGISSMFPLPSSSIRLIGWCTLIKHNHIDKFGGRSSASPMGILNFYGGIKDVGNYSKNKFVLSNHRILIH